ncbi:MAG TPA: hypothetical protein VFM90_05060 [Cyclobacteriaceae bacterium]|nr:hypothetical protein [Cyclobacteriaceae bacterium]
MNMLKKYALILMAITAVTFTGCSDDDDKNPGDVRDGIIAEQNDPDLVVDDLQGAITTDITLSADKDWVLTGALVVKAGAKLTIEPGTNILAEAGGTGVYIAVERNAEIQAVGTAANPIEIKSAATNPAAGDWGGLMIMGNAKITGGGLAVTEVVDFIYGNGVDSDDEDNSGNLEYVIIRHTGAIINAEKEFNGLTLYGVGSGTTIRNIALFDGNDDAIEWFGGSVDVENLLVVNARDDMFDWTQGWSGTGTNFYGVREAGFDAVSSDPRGIEGDGNLDGLTPGLAPQSNATITNITIVNKSTAVFSDVIKIRRNSTATVTNALIVWGGSPAPGDVVDLQDGAVATGSASANTTVTVSGTGTNLNMEDNVAGLNNATITVEATTGVADPATLFAWTGYTGF